MTLVFGVGGGLSAPFVKFIKFLKSGCTVVEHSSTEPETKGSNPGHSGKLKYLKYVVESIYISCLS